MIAIAHLLLFRYINGKEADGPHRVAPQSYITTASNILANIFGFALRAALAIAFAQYLWHIFRVSTMKVSTIELLFTIRTNIFLLLRPVVIQASPVLFALAVLMWASQVVTSFPPGAITVISSQKTTYDMRSVPNYDATFVGFQSKRGVIDRIISNLCFNNRWGISQVLMPRDILLRASLLSQAQRADFQPCMSFTSLSISLRFKYCILSQVGSRRTAW